MPLQLSGTNGVQTTGLPFLVGQVCFFAMIAAPSGFLICDGRAVSRTTYASLFAAIGTLYGVGNGSTTFNLPDLRGEFIRGWDGGRGVDTGRTIGSYQADELRSHTHTFDRTFIVSNGENDNNAMAGPGYESATTGATGGAETRPRNVALLPCVFAGV